MGTLSEYYDNFNMIFYSFIFLSNIFPHLTYGEELFIFREVTSTAKNLYAIWSISSDPFQLEQFEQ